MEFSKKKNSRIFSSFEQKQLFSLALPFIIWAVYF